MKHISLIGLGVSLCATFAATAAERLPTEVTRDKAITQLIETTKAHPKDVGAWHDLAALYLEDKKWDLAIEAENKAIANHPKYASAYYGRGLGRFGKKEFHQAREDFLKAARLWEGPQGLEAFLSLEQAKPEHVNAYKMRARAWAEEAKPSEALADMTTAIKLRKQDADLYLERADLREKAGLIPEAIADYRLSALLFMDRGDITRAEETNENLARLKATKEFQEVKGRIQEKRTPQ